MIGCDVCLFIHLVFDHYMTSCNINIVLSFSLSGRGEAFGGVKGQYSVY